ncbi:MAG: hypothetical protein COS08_07800 [Euryarchaeota archaeon CG01_land_8_20_14_3_00_38_12]|nr:MAG: hypothetical protein COS08_07800 [Euryarchaeota archaeon CG01_land_8_20_14_3_00_38_12]
MTRAPNAQNGYFSSMTLQNLSFSLHRFQFRTSDTLGMLYEMATQLKFTKNLEENGRLQQ